MQVKSAGQPVAHPAAPARARTERNSRATYAITALAGIAAAGVTLVVGYWTLFSEFAAYDDSGYFLVSIKGYLHGGVLYNHIYAEYGPFFFQFMAAVYAVTGLPVTNDSGDFVTLGLWFAAALVLAVAVVAWTRRPLLALAAYLVAFQILAAAPNEPASPGHLIVLLLAAMAAVSVLGVPHKPRLALFALGSLCAMALLSKINIGVFAFAALAYACVFTSRRLAESTPLVWLMRVGLVLGPILLMTRNLHDLAYTRFALHVALCALALVVVHFVTEAPGRERSPAASSWAGWAALGAASVLGVSVGIVLAQGTTFAALVKSLVVVAFNQASTFSVPPAIPWGTLVLDAISVGAAVIVVSSNALREERWRNPVAAARLLAGILTWACLVESRPLTLPATLVWVAALPTSRDRPELADRFARLFVPALAILQTLHAYPVAGSQKWFGAFLFAFVGAVCIADGIEELDLHVIQERFPVRTAITAALAAWAAAISVLGSVQWPHAQYSNGVPLGVRGAERIHVDRNTAATFKQLVRTIRERCATFITSPGLGSLYLMSGRTPPTYWDGSTWMFAVDSTDQRRGLDEVSDVRHLCAIRSPALEQFWARKRPIPQRPLYRFVRHGFHTVARIDGYDVMVRNGT